MEKLFVYGTLRFPKHQKQALGRTVEGTPAVLDGYRKRLRMMPDGRYFVIVPEKGTFVRGRILRLFASELRQLDAWENGYRRVRVRAGDERVWAYVPRR